MDKRFLLRTQLLRLPAAVFDLGFHDGFAFGPTSLLVVLEVPLVVPMAGVPILLRMSPSVPPFLRVLQVRWSEILLKPFITRYVLLLVFVIWIALRLPCPRVNPLHAALLARHILTLLDATFLRP